MFFNSGLCLAFFERKPHIKFFSLLEYYYGSFFCTLLQILNPRSIKFAPLKGGFNVVKWYKTHPIAHWSILKSYGSFLTTSGER